MEIDMGLMADSSPLQTVAAAAVLRTGKGGSTKVTV